MTFGFPKSSRCLRVGLVARGEPTSGLIFRLPGWAPVDEFAADSPYADALPRNILEPSRLPPVSLPKSERDEIRERVSRRVQTHVLRPFFLCRGLPASAPDTQRFSTTWVASSIG